MKEQVVMILDKEEKQNITRMILDNLPQWFGIEEAKQEYIDESAHLQFWAYKEEEKVLGFLGLKRHFTDSAEIYVMGVLPQYHRKHIGTELFTTCQSWCRQEGIEYIQVKTLSDEHQDVGYAKTRAFYKHVGFVPLEVFPTLWDANNPCLVMIQKIS